MDHLPRPRHADDRANIVIPNICQELYDGGSFVTSLSRTSIPASFHTVIPLPDQLPYHERSFNFLSDLAVLRLDLRNLGF